MPKKYTMSHLDMLSQLSETLSAYPPILAADSQEEIDYMTSVNKLLFPSEGNNDKFPNVIAMKNSVSMSSGAGLTVVFPKFQEERTESIPEYLDEFHDIVQDFLKDKALSGRDRVLSP